MAEMTREQAAAARRADQIAALEQERKGYVQRGLDSRVAQVDAAIEAARGKDAPKARAPRQDRQITT